MDKNDGGSAEGAATSDRTNCVPALVSEEVDNRKKRSRADRDVCRPNAGATFRAQQIEQHRLPIDERRILPSPRRYVDSNELEWALAYRNETMRHSGVRLVQQHEHQLEESGAHRRAAHSRSDWLSASRCLNQQSSSFPSELTAWRWRRLDLLDHLLRCEEQKVQLVGEQVMRRREPTFRHGRELGDVLVERSFASRMMAAASHNERTAVVHVAPRDVPERVSSAPHRRTGSGTTSDTPQAFRGQGADQVTSRQEDTDGKPTSQIPSSPQSLALPSDDGIFSGTQLLIRQSILVFEAQPKDIDFFANSQGRNKRVALGQVGLRCRYCVKRPLHYCGRGSVYFPGSLSTIYQAAQNMATNHFLSGCCEDMPNEVKEAFSTEIRRKKHKKAKRSAGKEYWECACRSLGLEDREGHYGVWYRGTSSKK